MRSRTRSLAPVAIVLLAAFAVANAAPSHKAAPQKAPAQKTASAHSSLATERQKTSYALGMKLGNDLGNMMVSMKDDVDATVVLNALNATFTNGKAELTIPQAQEQIEAFGKLQQERQQAAQAKKPAPVHKATPADRHKLSYALGMKFGADLGGMMDSMKDDVDPPIVLRAINAMAVHGATELTIPEAQTQLQAFGKKMDERQKAAQQQQAAATAKLGQKNQTDGAAFLAANAKKPGVKSTASGLQYMVENMGSGPKPKASDRVKVNYAGSLLDGTEFDSSAKNGGPIVLSLGGVIPGWTEGLQLMPVGSKFVFWIPGKLAYGDRGAPPTIGPSATLKFEVELLSIEK